jgi:hypothetical protein
MAIGAEHLLVAQPVCFRLTFGCRSYLDVVHLGFKVMRHLLSTSFTGQSITFNNRFSDVLLASAVCRSQPHVVQIEDFFSGEWLVFCCLEVAEFTAHVLLGFYVRGHHHAYALRAEALSYSVLLARLWYARLVFASNPVCHVPPENPF